MTRNLWRHAAAACATGLMLGCVSVLSPAPSVLTAPMPAAKPAIQPEANLSGELDGPTLRLAMRDLAVILDTLGRLEQVRPELKSEMLRELADADGVTAAAVVKKWRARVAELQPPVATRAAPPQPDPISLASAATPSASPAPAPPSVPPASAPRPHNPVRQPQRLELEPVPVEPERSHSWDELLQSLISQTRDRVEAGEPDASRARVQASLLELLWQSEQNAAAGHEPDPELWTQLAPAVEWCLGAQAATTRDGAVDSLHVATELVRGPHRFHARNLALCRRIRGFGKFERIEVAAFRPGQPLLLYSEVEHFLSEPGADGFRSRLSSTIELVDSAGRPVWRQEFAAVEDHSAAPRRDYFLSHSLRLPNELQPGRYNLQLVLHDELAGRRTSSTIALTIAE